MNVHESKGLAFLHVIAGLEITRSLVMVSYVTGTCGCPFLSTLASTISCPGNCLYHLALKYTVIRHAYCMKVHTHAGKGLPDADWSTI